MPLNVIKMAAQVDIDASLLHQDGCQVGIGAFSSIKISSSPPLTGFFFHFFVLIAEQLVSWVILGGGFGEAATGDM